MNRQQTIQVFSALAVLVGLAVSYFPPSHNAEAIWGIVGLFLGNAMRDIFTVDK